MRRTLSVVVLILAGCASAPTPTPAPAHTTPLAADDDGQPDDQADARANDRADDEAEAAIAAWRAARAAATGAVGVASRDDGDDVHFIDEVVAVSFKNTGDRGTYLSFGRPYPEQVLSVWIPKAVWDALETRAVLRRDVEVAGRLRHTATGPVVELARAVDLGVIPVDESVLDAEALRTRPHARLIRLALVQRLARGDPKAPETAQLLERLYRTLDGQLSAFFFDAVGLPSDADEAAFIRRWAQLQTWADQVPGSVGAALAEASLHVDRAWAIRGNGPISTVSPSAVEQFLEGLRRAEKVLAAQPAAKKTVQGFACWQAIALGLGWPTSRYEALFNEAVAAFPDHVPIYAAAARRLLPWWYGAPGAMEAFIDEQRALRGGDDGDILYAQLAWTMDSVFPHRIFRSTALSWPTTAHGLEALIARGEYVNYWRSVYAHLAAEVDDVSRLGPALDAMGDNADMGVWINLQNVASARQRVREVRRLQEADTIDDE